MVESFIDTSKPKHTKEIST
jgi:hypothetical protein